MTMRMVEIERIAFMTIEAELEASISIATTRRMPTYVK